MIVVDYIVEHKTDPTRSRIRDLFMMLNEFIIQVIERQLIYIVCCYFSIHDSHFSTELFNIIYTNHYIILIIPC